MFILYLVLSGVGLVGTWFFNLRSASGGAGGYLAGWFANDAASSAAVDLLVVAAAAIAFMVVEGRRLRLRITWLAVALTLPVALAFTFPLFLAFRHRRLVERSVDRSRAAVAGGVA